MGPQQVCWAPLMGLKTCPTPKPTEQGGEPGSQTESSTPGQSRTSSPKEGISGTKHHMSFGEKWGGMGLSPKGMREKISPRKQPVFLEQGTTRS